MNIKECFTNSINELNEIGKRLNYSEIELAAETINRKQRIFFTAMGRSGNIAKALAIRFMHLGKDVYVALDASTPSIGKDDLLIAISSSGNTATIKNHIDVAIKNNAEIIVFTSNAENVADRNNVFVVSIPDKKQVPSVQHAGSLFEQAILLIGDAIATYLIEKEGIHKQYLDGRHANLQ